MQAVVSSYTLTHAQNVMSTSHMRPHDVSGESCLTVNNTLVPYILFHIYIVSHIYSCIPSVTGTLMSYLLFFHMYVVSFFHSVTNTLVSYFASHICVASLSLFALEKRDVLSVSVPISFNQFQSIAISYSQLQFLLKSVPNTFNIASLHDTNVCSSLIFCNHTRN
jgi:hypothetical protein